MKKQLIGAALLLLFLLAGCGQEEVKEAETSAVAVEVTMVQRGSISAESRVSGQVASGNQESVFVATSARCTRVYVEVGDTVTAGQAICTLDVASTWANFETARMSLEAAQKSYDDQAALLQQQVAQAEKNVEDTKALFAVGAASQMEVDNAELTLENARASMNSALSQLEISIQNYRATLSQLEASLANVNGSGNVTAPISGTVVSLNAAANSFVSPSMPVVTIDQTSDREVATAVSETLVAKLHTGDRVNISIQALDRTFTGTISNIEQSANMQTHLYGVTVKIPASETKGLLSGMFADVTFYTDTQNSVVVIPTDAIQTGTNGQYVYVLDDNDTAHMVQIQTGLVGDGVTEVTGGLSGGERLVTVGQFFLSEGAQARVVSAEV